MHASVRVRVHVHVCVHIAVHLSGCIHTHLEKEDVAGEYGQRWVVGDKCKLLGFVRHLTAVCNL